MRRKNTTRIFAILAFTIAMTISAQQNILAQEYVTTPVSISKEKVRVNGRICYSHIVLEKQTLFSIAKAYNVTVDDIYSLNPSIKETGLKKNSIILIPSQEATAVEPQKMASEKQRIHVRKWYEDLDVIAQKYGVSVEALMKANNLKGRKLANRQELIIPDVEMTDEPLTDKIESADTSAFSETVPQTDSLENIAVSSAEETARRDVEATIILPLKSNDNQPSKNNMDFYCGALLAVRDLGNDGISTDLNVYDLSDTSHPVTIEDIEKSDVIIGPVSAGDLKRMLDSVSKNDHIISPLDPRAEVLTQTYENLIHAPSPHRAQYTDLLSWIKEDSAEGDKVILISEKGARQTDALAQMQAVLDSCDLTYETFSYNILEGRDITDPLTAMMTTEMTNRVLVASESEAFVNDVVRNLNILIYNKMNLVLYAPAKIRSFDTIEVENLHNTSAHISCGYYIDYENPQVRDFILKYRALYKAEPSQFAFQGYDTTKYFIELCSKYGKRWHNKLDNFEQGMLQSTFKFCKNENGGFVNFGVRRIVYGKNWSVKTLK